MSDLGFYTKEMLQGAEVTLEITAAAAGVSLVGGAVLAAIRIYGPKVARAVIVAFVEVIRGTPAILQLFILYFGLPQFGLDLSPFVAAFVWMCLYGTGYAIEIFRAGLEGVTIGQHEAAAALGLRRVQAFRRIIIPQAVNLMLPPLTNWVILELKNTTLVYFIGVHEVMFNARQAANNSFQPLPIYLIAAGIYLVLNLVISAGGSRLERRTALVS